MVMDDRIYDEPHKFIPERFRDKCFNNKNQKSAITEYDPESKIFGFGRR